MPRSLHGHTRSRQPQERRWISFGNNDGLPGVPLPSFSPCNDIGSITFEQSTYFEYGYRSELLRRYAASGRLQSAAGASTGSSACRHIINGTSNSSDVAAPCLSLYATFGRSALPAGRAHRTLSRQAGGAGVGRFDL